MRRSSHHHRPRDRRWLGLGLVASAMLIAGADVAFHELQPGLVIAGGLDEPAHAATTIILLGALGWPRTRGLGAAALVASVAIDLDHIPRYLGSSFLTAGTARPYPHSFVTLLLVALIAWGTHNRARCLALGTELGLVGHMFRDMAEPSSKAGVALFWPISDANVRIPYALYATVMGGLLLVALYRFSERRCRASPNCRGPSGGAESRRSRPPFGSGVDDSDGD